MRVKQESTLPPVIAKRESITPPITKRVLSQAWPKHENVTPPANPAPGVGGPLDVNKIDLRGE